MKAIITFLLIFCVIVVFHEFGHFFFAKRSGILVREFAIGMVMSVWLVGVKIQLRLRRVALPV